ncbi:MAG: MFS transporter [Blautia sp.]
MNNRKRWSYLIAGTVMLLFLGLIYAWSIFKAPFNQIYTDWSESQLSLTFTISMIFFCLGGFSAGMLLKKLPARVVLWLSAALLFVGFFGVSRLNPEQPGSSLTLLYVFYGFFCGGGVGIGYNTVISTVNKWFTDRPGIASGLMLMGFGLGGIILGSAVNSLIGAIGLFTTFLVLAVMITIILLLGSFFMKSPQAATVQDTATAVKEVPSITTAQMLRTPSFWLFVLWAVLLNSAGLLVINSAASIALAFGAPAVMGLVVSLCNGGGRVFMGSFFDKFSTKPSLFLNVCFTFGAGLFLFLGAVKFGIPFVLIGLLLAGVGYGSTPTLTSAFIHKEYGPKYYPVNFSLGNFALIPAAIVGPMISSVLIEKAGGAYDTTFIMIMVLAAAALVVYLLLNWFSKK